MSLDLPRRIGRLVERRPVLVVGVFLVGFLLTLPVLAQMSVYINVYDVSPRTEYYPHYVTLNTEMGWDNLAFVLLTPQEEESVITPEAVREMDALGQRVEHLPYVEGTVSLATVVKLLHQQATGEFTLPPDNAAGDALIERYVAVALDQFGDQVLYGNILARDHQAGLVVVTMPTGVDLKAYRDWNRELLEVGLEVDEANPHRDALEMRPLSLDMIWIWIERSTTEEGPSWVLFAAIVATLSLYALYRRWPEVLASLVTLVLVMLATVAAAYTVGVRFNLLSMIMMALIFGLGVDYCMHVTSRFREERALGHPPGDAVATAVRHVGAALWMSAVSTTVGFASLYFSLIPAIGQFGIMLGAGILTAYLASLLLLPALLLWIDRRRDEFPILQDLDEEEVEARRMELTEELRATQRESFLGRLGRWSSGNRRLVALGTLLLVGALLVPYLTHGVDVWTGSYTRPHPVLDEDLYPMETLQLAEAVFGIPVDMSVMVYGDATDPAVVAMVKDLQGELRGVHASFNVESVLFPLEYWLNLTQEGRQCNCDQDGNGIPDTRADLERAYADLRGDRAMSLPLQRVLTEDGRVTAVRLKINPAGTTVDLGSDVANYRKAREDTEAIVAQYQEDHPELTSDVEFATTGLAVLGVEVVDAIVRGNAASIAIMLTVIFGLITYFWRDPLVSLVTMIPVFLAILTQYSVTAALGYQVTYVSLIVTGGATGIGVDDGIHLVSRAREEVTAGRSPREAVTLANSEIGAVLAGTTVTDLSAFFLVIFSFVVWGSQTAIVVIPTLVAAFLATVVVLPAVVSWHAERSPERYREKERRGLLDLLPGR